MQKWPIYSATQTLVMFLESGVQSPSCFSDGFRVAVLIFDIIATPLFCSIERRLLVSQSVPTDGKGWFIKQTWIQLNP